MRCIASIEREEVIYARMGKEETSEAAQWGTDSHAYAEQGLNLGLSPLYLHDGSPEELEKAECADEFYRYVTDRRQTLKPCALRVEEKAYPGRGFGDTTVCWGTADATLCSIDTLEVVDLKGGRGLVEPDSLQLGLYLLGMLGDYWQDRSLPMPFRTLRTTIVQPRAPHALGTVRSTDWQLDELLELEKRLHEVELTMDAPDMPGVAGEKQCRWCRAKTTCPEYSSSVFNSLMITSGVVEGESVAATLDFKAASGGIKSMGEGTLAALLDMRDSVASWLKAVEDEARARLDRGATIPGYKVTRGTARPAWKEDNTAVPKSLRKLKLKKGQIFNDQLKTPLQVMKDENLTEEQSKAIADLWSRPEGAWKLVRSTTPGDDAAAYMATIPT